MRPKLFACQQLADLLEELPSPPPAQDGALLPQSTVTFIHTTDLDA